MNPTTLIIPAITLTTMPLAASADITHLEDNRSYNSNLLLFGGPGTTTIDDERIVYFNDFDQVIIDSLENSISDPVIGNANTSVDFESSITHTEFYSNATTSASATTFEGGSIAFANMAVFNSVYFTIDETTNFNINGFVSGSNSTSESVINFSSRTENGDYIDTIFDQYSFNQTISINTTLELEAGAYSFFALSYASPSAFESNRSFSGTAAHEITVTVVPTPASSALLFLASSTLLIRRRR